MERRLHDQHTMTPIAPPSFHVLAKPTGAICNLACRYCFFLEKEKLYPGSRFRMSDELLEEFIRQYIEAQQVPQVTIAWQGGEPTLMGLEFFRRSVELAEQYRRPGMRVDYTIQTNGTLLNDEWCTFFKEHNFLVGISIDGPKELHDAYRVDKRGRGTFGQVMAGLRCLQEHNVEYNILCAVHAANEAHPLETYRFFRDEADAQFLQFIPIVEREGETGFQEESTVTDRTVNPGNWGRFLCTVFDEWVRRDVGGGLRAALRYDPCGMGGPPSRSLHVCTDLWGCGGSRAQRGPLLMRSFRGSGSLPWEYHGNASHKARWFSRTAKVRAGQTGRPSPFLQGVPCSLCLPRRMPQKPVCPDT